MSTAMRKYETVVITKTDAGHEALRKLYERLTEQMARVALVTCDSWKRRLAYPIGKSLASVSVLSIWRWRFCS